MSPLKSFTKLGLLLSLVCYSVSGVTVIQPVEVVNKSATSIAPLPITFKNGLNDSIPLSTEEKHYLKQLVEIKICIDPDWMPFERINANGKHDGMLADYMQLLSRRMAIPFRLIATENYSQSKQYLMAGKCDIISADVNTELISENYLSSQAYFVSPRVFVVHVDTPYITDFNEITDKKIAVVINTPAEELLPILYPNIALYTVESTDIGIQKVASKEFYAFVNILGVVSYSLQQQSLSSVKIGGVLPSNIRLSVLVNNQHKELVAILNRAIDTISGQDRKQIFDRWISVQFVQGVDYSLIWQILIGAILLLSIISYRYRELKTLNDAIAKANKKTQLTNQKLLETQLALEESNRVLEQLSVTDKLTKLFNRTKLDTVFSIELERCKRYGDLLSLILLDVDNFKRVNDLYGHQIGDKVLVALATVLKNELRNSDILGRWGGGGVYDYLSTNQSQASFNSCRKTQDFYR